DARVHPIVRSHHERWDGAGYPDQLRAEEIPLFARIVAVADAFDAMTSDRPYHPEKKGRPPAEAFAEVGRQSGRRVDPACAAALEAIQTEVLDALQAEHQTARVASTVRTSA